MSKKGFLKRLMPDDYYHSIYDIELTELTSRGIRGLIVDLDNTLVPRKQNHTTQKLENWLKGAKSLGLNVCIVSNNWKSRGSIFAKNLDISLVARAKKPRKSPFNKALKLLKTEENETVVVGDQIFTDILGGNRCGLHTILVVPMSKKEDLFLTKFTRQLERFVLKRLKKDNIVPKTNGRALDQN